MARARTGSTNTLNVFLILLHQGQHRWGHVVPEFAVSLQFKVPQTCLREAQGFWTITAGLFAFGSQILKEIWEYTSSCALSIKDVLQSTILLHQYFLNECLKLHFFRHLKEIFQHFMKSSDFWIFWYISMFPTLKICPDSASHIQFILSSMVWKDKKSAKASTYNNLDLMRFFKYQVFCTVLVDMDSL